MGKILSNINSVIRGLRLRTYGESWEDIANAVHDLCANAVIDEPRILDEDIFAQLIVKPDNLVENLHASVMLPALLNCLVIKNQYYADIAAEKDLLGDRHPWDFFSEFGYRYARWYGVFTGREGDFVGDVNWLHFYNGDLDGLFDLLSQDHIGKNAFVNLDCISISPDSLRDHKEQLQIGNRQITATNIGGLLDRLARGGFIGYGTEINFNALFGSHYKVLKGSLCDVMGVGLCQKDVGSALDADSTSIVLPRIEIARYSLSGSRFVYPLPYAVITLYHDPNDINNEKYDAIRVQRREQSNNVLQIIEECLRDWSLEYFPCYSNLTGQPI